MKPVLFLDFDRTLFDTERLYVWLGEDYFQKILAIVGGRSPSPDFASFLYDDTVPFLKRMRKTHRLVVLTYSVNTMFTRKKLRGSGVIPLVDDVIITQRDKGLEIKEYFARAGEPGWEHTFIDDAPQNIHEVKQHNPDIRCVRIDRKPLPADAAYADFSPPDDVVKNLEELEELF